MKYVSLFATGLLAVFMLMVSSTAYAQMDQSPTKQPDFGPNVVLVGPGDDLTQVQARIDTIYARQKHSEFGSERYAVLFKSGTYKIDIPVGYYTQVNGLGLSPDDVHLVGNIHADAPNADDKVTTNFWRGIEGVHITPDSGTMQWAVSQATWLRRIHISGDLRLHQNRGWASGGWLSDAVIDGTVESGSQQQWLSRNVDWGGWSGSNWNMVFVGVPNAPAGDFPHPPFTRVNETPVIREKPYLYEKDGVWGVFVPELQHDTAGAQWPKGAKGHSLPLSTFYIARPETDTAQTLNDQLRAGKNLLLTPGTYALSHALRVSRPDTVVLGLGFATLHPVNGNAALTVDDVDGVSIAGVLFDAGLPKSPVLMEVGKSGVHRDHKANPIALFDVIFRDGGADPGKVGVNLAVHSDNTLIDQTWIWRADHGAHVGWTDNTSDTGLLVTGDEVTVYGLFVEHHQKYQVDWTGENGRVYFYQSELPYDPPNQAAWRSAPGVNGWAAYRVGKNVRHHEAWGLGIYSVFTYPDVNLTRAVEAPEAPGVRFHNLTTVSLVNRGEITHIVNDIGDATIAGPVRVDRTLKDYPLP
ncbi:MAG: coagulation factor 5/8 type domain-containing protein [Asticcacaulis sp.]